MLKINKEDTFERLDEFADLGSIMFSNNETRVESHQTINDRKSMCFQFVEAYEAVLQDSVFIETLISPVMMGFVKGIVEWRRPGLVRYVRKMYVQRPDPNRDVYMLLLRQAV